MTLPAGSTVTAKVAIATADWRENLLQDPALGLVDESHLLDIGTVGQVALVAAPVPKPDDDLLHTAEDAARTAGTAVVVVGLTEEQETEAAANTPWLSPDGRTSLCSA